MKALQQIKLTPERELELICCLAAPYRARGGCFRAERVIEIFELLKEQCVEYSLERELELLCVLAAPLIDRDRPIECIIEGAIRALEALKAAID